MIEWIDYLWDMLGKTIVIVGICVAILSIWGLFLQFFFVRLRHSVVFWKAAKYFVTKENSSIFKIMFMPVQSIDATVDSRLKKTDPND